MSETQTKRATAGRTAPGPVAAIERGFYVAVGAADLAGEKIRELPPVKIVVERTNKLRSTSIIDQAREIEPKFRKQAKELQARGENVMKRVREEAKDFGQQLREFPTEARKQLQDFPDTARKQATEIREAIEKRLGRENGKAAKPAAKTSAKSTASTVKVS